MCQRRGGRKHSRSATGDTVATRGRRSQLQPFLLRMVGAGGLVPRPCNARCKTSFANPTFEVHRRVATCLGNLRFQATEHARSTVEQALSTCEGAIGIGTGRQDDPRVCSVMAVLIWRYLQKRGVLRQVNPAAPGDLDLIGASSLITLVPLGLNYDGLVKEDPRDMGTPGEHGALDSTLPC